MNVGFCKLEVSAVLDATPKFQLQFVILPVVIVDKSVNELKNVSQTAGDAKATFGPGATVTTNCAVSKQFDEGSAVSVTVYVPAEVYVYVGFDKLLVSANVVVTPKFQR